MKIAIPLERRAHERRVAATPDTVKRFVSMGIEVSVESGAGEKAAILDNDYIVAGATIHKTRIETFEGADIILKVQRPIKIESQGIDEISMLRKDLVLIGLLGFSIMS